MIKESYLKLLTIGLALSIPIIILTVYGVNFKSFSKLWETPLQPIFIISNTTVSFFFYGLNRWRIPSIFLMLLVAFSTSMYSNIHNICAIGFFISCIYALAEYKRMRIYLILYCCSVFTAVFGIFWFEVYTSYILCFYHFNVLYKKYQFENRNLENN